MVTLKKVLGVYIVKISDVNDYTFDAVVTDAIVTPSLDEAFNFINLTLSAGNSRLPLCQRS